MKKLFFIFLIFVCKYSFAQTPVFCCGAECGVGDAHFVIAGGATTFSTSTVRNGSRSFRANVTVAAAAFQSIAFANSNTLVARIYVRFASLPTLGTQILWTNNTLQPGVYFNSTDSKLYSGYGGATPTLGATGVTVTTGQWYLIDLKVVTTGNPWTIDVNVDETATGQATRAVAAESFALVSFGVGVSATADLYFDDLVLSNTSSDYPLGAGYVNHFVPVNPDGTHSGLTAADFQRTLTGTDILNSTTDSYLLLDDVPLETGASVDWINMVAPVASTYTEHIFGPAPGISTPTVAPRAAEFIIGIHQAGTGTGTMIVQLNDNGSTGTIYSASLVAGVTSVAYKRVHFIDPPSAATVWTLSGNGNFNNARIRFGPTATVDANPDQYLDCAMIEAEFAGDPPVGSPRKNKLPFMGVGSAKIKSENGIEKSYSYYQWETMIAILPRNKLLINFKKQL